MKKRLVDTFVEEVVIDGDRKIHTKFRADLVNLIEDDKEETSRSGESEDQRSTLFDSGQIIIQL